MSTKLHNIDIFMKYYRNILLYGPVLIQHNILPFKFVNHFVTYIFLTSLKLQANLFLKKLRGINTYSTDSMWY